MRGRSIPMKLTSLQLGAACLFAACVWAMINSLESISPVVDNMPAQGSGIYVSIGSYQWMGRWRIYQEVKKELVSIIDQLKGSTASHSERKTTRETSDIIGMWIEITWANAIAFAFCLLFSVPLLFSSQITRPRVSPVCNVFTHHVPDHEDLIQTTPPKIQEQEIANKGKRIGIEDLQGHFGCTRKDAAARLGGNVLFAIYLLFSTILIMRTDAGLFVLWKQYKSTDLLRFLAHAVSVSTLKRKCREHGIMRWPDPTGSCGSDPIQEFFDGEINWGTEKDSTAETSEIPTIRDSCFDNCSCMDFYSPSILKESEEVNGSCERTVQVKDQSAKSTVYRNPNPLVFVQPQVASTQMASENLGSSNDGRTSLAFQAQQDTWFVKVKAIHGNTIIRFSFRVASGIIGLKEEVLKRLKFEVDSFEVKYKDDEGDLILIACDEDVFDFFRPLGDQLFKLFVITKTPN